MLQYRGLILNRWVFSRCCNDRRSQCRCHVSIFYHYHSGSEFQACEAATGNARLPTVDSLTCRIDGYYEYLANLSPIKNGANLTQLQVATNSTRATFNLIIKFNMSPSIGKTSYKCVEPFKAVVVSSSLVP